MFLFVYNFETPFYYLKNKDEEKAREIKAKFYREEFIDGTFFFIFNKSLLQIYFTFQIIVYLTSYFLF